MNSLAWGGQGPVNGVKEEVSYIVSNISKLCLVYDWNYLAPYLCNWSRIYETLVSCVGNRLLALSVDVIIAYDFERASKIDLCESPDLCNY